MNRLVCVFNNHLLEHKDAELIKAADFHKMTIRTSTQLLIFNKLFKDVSPAQLWLDEGLQTAIEWLNNTANAIFIFFGPTGFFFYCAQNMIFIKD
jgi:hypothetical protein